MVYLFLYNISTDQNIPRMDSNSAYMNGKIKECHKVLTTSIKDTNPKGENIKHIIIDRNINGDKNILKISESWLKNKTRPKVFCRNNKL